MYDLEVYKVGYRSNDPNTTYFDMGRPKQLTKDQVLKIKETNNGSSINREKISVKEGTPFQKEFETRENDVLLLTFTKIYDNN